MDMLEKRVAVIAETEHGELTMPTLECVEEGREVADSLNAALDVLLPGHEIAALADELAAHGADRVTVIEHEALAQFSADGWLAALAPVLREAEPVITLAPDSGYGRAWMPRLSARWRIPLVSGCIRVKVMPEGYTEMFRVTHSGMRHERLIWSQNTLVGVMLAPGVRGFGPRRSQPHAQIQRVKPDLQAAGFRDRTLRTQPPDPHTVDLTEAERIVSGGLGAGGPEGMALLQQLADQLSAALGGTRVVADRGWLAADRFIGTTGKIVAPKLYIGFGISGAVQHIAGIRESEIIVAINTDRTSPLLKMADLGVVGDLHAIVPLVLEKLQGLAERNAKPAGAAVDEPDLQEAHP